MLMKFLFNFEVYYACSRVLFSSEKEEQSSVSTRVLVNTPYGGRLVVRLPAGTLLYVHLKDKKLIRNKKRWSQVCFINVFVVQ